jgi:methionyl-tRNA synthetase
MVKCGRHLQPVPDICKCTLVRSQLHTHQPQLLKPACTLCQSPPEIKSTRHIFLDLPALQPRLESWIDAASVKGAWSSNSIQVTRDVLMS